MCAGLFVQGFEKRASAIISKLKGCLFTSCESSCIYSLHSCKSGFVFKISVNYFFTKNVATKHFIRKGRVALSGKNFSMCTNELIKKNYVCKITFPCT